MLILLIIYIEAVFIACSASGKLKVQSDKQLIRNTKLQNCLKCTENCSQLHANPFDGIYGQFYAHLFLLKEHPCDPFPLHVSGPAACSIIPGTDGYLPPPVTVPRGQWEADQSVIQTAFVLDPYSSCWMFLLKTR